MNESMGKEKVTDPEADVAEFRNNLDGEVFEEDLEKELEKYKERAVETAVTEATVKAFEEGLDAQASVSEDVPSGNGGSSESNPPLTLGEIDSKKEELDPLGRPIPKVNDPAWGHVTKRG